MGTTASLNLLLEITAQFDDLATGCLKELVVKGIGLEPQDKNYDISTICKGICSFMRSQGFSPFRGET